MDEFSEAPYSFPNPFRDNIVGDAWDVTDDVGAIHSHVFDACLGAVAHVRQFDTNAGLVIYGAAGTGKTHLISRLRANLTNHFLQPDLNKLRQIFAYVRLDTSWRSIARHVRSRVAADLLRRLDTGVSQFELLVIAKLMASENSSGDLLLWWEHFLDERRDDLDDLLSGLGEQAGLSTNFVRVLTHLVLRRHRLDVAGWLRGESLSETAYHRLDIAPSDHENPETEALDILRDFARLAGSHLPLVLCFDQVEALQTRHDDTQALFAYGQLMRNLCNANQNLLLISCMQSSLFQQIETAIPDYQRAAVHSMAAQSLNTLYDEEASLLLSARLKQMQSFPDWPQSEESLWPLRQEDIRQWTGTAGITPRRLLFEAAQVFDQRIRMPRVPIVNAPKTKTPSNDEAPLQTWLNRKWERRYDHSLQTGNPDDTIRILRNGLPDLIHLCDPEWTLLDEQIPGIEYLLSAAHNEARVGIALLDNSAYRLPRQLKQIIDGVSDSRQLQKLVLLRDERKTIGKTAQKTNKRIDDLVRDDAVLHFVPPEAVAALDAARSLLAAAKAGDLSFAGETVMPATVIEWLRRNLPQALKETVDVLVTQAGGKSISSTLVARLQELICESYVSDLATLAAELQVSEPELTQTIDDRDDLFGLISGSSRAIVFSAQLGGQCLASDLT